MEPSVLSLFVLGVVALTETRAGSHSMRYFYTSMSRPELGDSKFISVGYVDDQQFVRFNSSSESQRMEPRAAWIDKVDEEDRNHWERNTQRSRGKAEID
ncbi:class I histocompatibility antigen, Gogo-C*0202 alpha chain-like [Monodelphis domestica]|uniref:class I histocompatibility antigen, Gogo-C*0202 alpha chain-like n=1 Tax=Monodelphis domestica TaxID=13616 RepID=UPI0024E239B4|nr:class I histocompatibility antigen, Gogo-C*0202 alpha chain-like [Monodelphis domestica]